MIHSAEAEALAVQGVSKLMSESLAGSITIDDMRIDEKLNSFNEYHNKYKIIMGED